MDPLTEMIVRLAKELIQEIHRYDMEVEKCSLIR